MLDSNLNNDELDILALVHNYIKDNLRIEMSKGYDWGYEGDCIRVRLMLDNKEISNESVSIS